MAKNILNWNHHRPQQYGVIKYLLQQIFSKEALNDLTHAGVIVAICIYARDFDHYYIPYTGSFHSKGNRKHVHRSWLVEAMTYIMGFWPGEDTIISIGARFNAQNTNNRNGSMKMKYRTILKDVQELMDQPVPNASQPIIPKRTTIPKIPKVTTTTVEVIKKEEESSQEMELAADSKRDEHPKCSQSSDIKIIGEYDYSTIETMNREPASRRSDSKPRDSKICSKSTQREKKRSSASSDQEDESSQDSLKASIREKIKKFGPPKISPRRTRQDPSSNMTKMRKDKQEKCDEIIHKYVAAVNLQKEKRASRSGDSTKSGGQIEPKVVSATSSVQAREAELRKRFKDVRIPQPGKDSKGNIVHPPKILQLQRKKSLSEKEAFIFSRYQHLFARSGE